MCKSGICDTKPAISLKRSSLRPNLLQSVYKNSCAVCGEKSGDLRWTLAYYGARRNLATSGVWPIETYSPNFVNFDPGVPWYHAAIFISPSLMHL